MGKFEVVVLIGSLHAAWGGALEGYQKRLVKVFKAYEHEDGGREEGEICLVWGCVFEKCSPFYILVGDGWYMIPTCDNLIPKEDYCELVVLVLERWRICGVFVDSLSGGDLCMRHVVGFSTDCGTTYSRMVRRRWKL